jgi:hypothetical protein
MVFEQFEREITSLLRYFQGVGRAPKELSKDTLREYFEAFRSRKEADFARACARVRETRSTWPTIAQLRAAMGDFAGADHGDLGPVRKQQPQWQWTGFKSEAEWDRALHSPLLDERMQARLGPNWLETLARWEAEGSVNVHPHPEGVSPYFWRDMLRDRNQARDLPHPQQPLLEAPVSGVHQGEWS